MHILLHHLGQFAPKYDVMPLCPVGHLASIWQFITALLGSQPHTCHTNTCIYVSYFWLFANVSYQHYFIHNPYILFCKDSVNQAKYKIKEFLFSFIFNCHKHAHVPYYTTKPDRFNEKKTGSENYYEYF
jgi:hypothetical protein